MFGHMSRGRVGTIALLVGLLLLAIGFPPALAQTPPGSQEPPPAEPPAEAPDETPQVVTPPSAPAESQPEQAPVAPPTGSAALTLGDFAIRTATALKLTAPASGFTPEGAAAAILEKGIHLRAELTSTLTEADAVAVLTALGYRIRSNTPSRVVTGERADILIETFIAPQP